MNFSVVIATSQKRTDWLINRSLSSVYKQIGIDKTKWNIFIIDDNEFETEIFEIQKRIELLRATLKLNQTDFPTIVLKNSRTRYMSGTGAWNTGIYEAYRLSPDGYVSILDDDDEYLPNYLSDCVNAISKNTVAVFHRLIWKNDDTSTMNVDLTKEQLNAENFFIGNPGVQGSNMFFKTQNLVDIGGFDETLPNTSDRDLMIRFLWKNDLHKIIVIENIGVYHYNHNRPKVNNDIPRKQKGLDLFYKKYKAHFSEEAYQKSLKRAKKHFNYMPTEQIVICMPVKNAEKTIRESVLSVLKQTNTKREIVLLVGLDSSTDNTGAILKEFSSQNPNIVLLNLNFGKVYLTRNYLNEYARKNFPNCILIGRLDADDVIYSENTINQIEKLYYETSFDVLICGNKQARGGEILRWENRPSKNLLKKEFLLNQLFEMAQRNPKAELPSCNTFIKPFLKIDYPAKTSAEDHWFTVFLLLQKETLNIQVDENLVYCIYSLDGLTTSNNKKANAYEESRKELYEFFKHQDRIVKAKNILSEQGIEAIEYLGIGQEGVVFTDEKSVYKVLLPINKETISFEKAYRRKSFFINLPMPLKHLYCIELIKTQKTIIVKYPFEKGEKCINYTEEEAISILTELWQQKIIILDCKPENFIRVEKTIKIIDLDGKEYNDNLFLNLCARMYLYANYYNKYEYSRFQKLKRSAINNFEIPELEELRVFVNRVFANIIFEETKHFNQFAKPNEQEILEQASIDSNLEDLFFAKIKEHKYITGVYFDGVKLSKNNYFEPQNLRIGYYKVTPFDKKVSLLIKTCPQDTATIEENIKHIVKQLSYPNPFYEVVVSIDTKEKDFLREFNNKGTLKELLEKIKKLKSNNVIDRYILFDQTKTFELNKQWFDIETEASHTISNAPLAPQIYAFDQCMGDYILQMDADVLIGRKDYCHSFLSDMLSEFDKNKNVISVGFNIPNKATNVYFGFTNGGFVPEVRLGLLHKQRIYNLFPLPNSVDENGKPELTWQRSLFKKQIERNKVSIRGGDHRSFYIHPQNYRKKEPYAWLTILDKVEQNFLPDLQYGNFDVEGSLYDWSIPKRNEKIVIVSCFRNVSIDRFLRMWYSLMAQDTTDFGIILLDDNSENGLSYFIDTLIKPYSDKVTFIKKRNLSTRMENVYTVIHYYVSNPESIIVMLDGDDALIGNTVLTTISEKYDAFNADVVIGRFHQTYRIQPYYRYPVDFANPRKTGGNVWQHLKTFKKYLFDSIPLPYFKHQEEPINQYKNKWLQTCDDFAFMVPIVEIAQQPIQLDYINYYYERDYEKRNSNRDLKEQCIAEILTRLPLTKEDVFKGRKTFLPNINKVEIDITYNCNLKCPGCNRSCAQSPTKESVAFSDIKQFVEESIVIDKKWELINILGGEPTLHPEFTKIIHLIHEEFITKHSSKTILQIVSNGYEEKSRILCDEMKAKYQNVRIDYDSYKTNKVVEYFSPFNDAPIDDDNYFDADYNKGCWVTNYCGIGLNKNGYYACAVAGGIDRICQKKIAIPTLREITIELLVKQLEEFCKYCGNFKAYEDNYGNFIPRVEKEPFKNKMSKTWEILYKKFNEK